jgi:ParB-like chromosome segregation protein Spo0J
MDSAAKSDPKADVRGRVPDESNPAELPPGSEETMDQRLFRALEPSVRQTIDQLGRNTPEGQKLLTELEWETSPIAQPTKPDADGTQLIDVRLLEPSPLHHRTAPSSEEQSVLERSIAAEGLKHPIEVRRHGAKFEIICGHRRADAYRSLFQRATTDSERAKYKAIRAKVVSASDLEALLLGIIDDLVREEFPSADAARSIHMLRHLDPKLWSAQKLADRTGLPVRRIRRYLQLGKAPLFIQAAWRDGMTVQVEGADGSVHEEDRKLDLLVALEFDRLHAALSKKKGAGERNADGAEEPLADDEDQSSDDADEVSANGSSAEDKETAADRKTRQGIERALIEDWGFREVKRYVDKAISALDAPAAKRGKPRVPFKWSKRRLQVDVDQVGALDASQKKQLRAVIQEILTKL